MALEEFIRQIELLEKNKANNFLIQKSINRPAIEIIVPKAEMENPVENILSKLGLEISDTLINNKFNGYISGKNIQLPAGDFIYYGKILYENGKIIWQDKNSNSFIDGFKLITRENELNIFRNSDKELKGDYLLKEKDFVELKGDFTSEFTNFLDLQSADALSYNLVFQPKGGRLIIYKDNRYTLIGDQEIIVVEAFNSFELVNGNSKIFSEKNELFCEHNIPQFTQEGSLIVPSYMQIIYQDNIQKSKTNWEFIVTSNSIDREEEKKKIEYFSMRLDEFRKLGKQKENLNFSPRLLRYFSEKFDYYINYSKVLIKTGYEYQEPALILLSKWNDDSKVNETAEGTLDEKKIDDERELLSSYSVENIVELKGNLGEEIKAIDKNSSYYRDDEGVYWILYDKNKKILGSVMIVDSTLYSEWISNDKDDLEKVIEAEKILINIDRINKELAYKAELFDFKRPELPSESELINSPELRLRTKEQLEKYGHDCFNAWNHGFLSDEESKNEQIWFDKFEKLLY